jgi:nucleoside-diphosphate kinase
VQERSYFMIKPDGVVRGLEEDIKNRVLQNDFKIVKSFKHQVTNEEAADLYSVHQGKPFYSGLINFITSGPVICNIVEGEDAIKRLRVIMGATDPRKAKAGTIRGDLREENIFSKDKTIKNLVHGSDSLASAEREIPIFFKEEK